MTREGRMIRSLATLSLATVLIAPARLKDAYGVHALIDRVEIQNDGIEPPTVKIWGRFSAWTGRGIMTLGAVGYLHYVADSNVIEAPDAVAPRGDTLAATSVVLKARAAVDRSLPLVFTGPPRVSLLAAPRARHPFRYLKRYSRTVRPRSSR